MRFDKKFSNLDGLRASNLHIARYAIIKEHFTMKIKKDFYMKKRIVLCTVLAMTLMLTGSVK